MSQATQSVPVAVPLDVHAFAHEHGVGEQLPKVVEMTRRIFPDTPISVQIEDDPEIANDLCLGRRTA